FSRVALCPQPAVIPPIQLLRTWFFGLGLLPDSTDLPNLAVLLFGVTRPITGAASRLSGRVVESIQSELLRGTTGRRAVGHGLPPVSRHLLPSVIELGEVAVVGAAHQTDVVAFGPSAATERMPVVVFES